MDVGGHRKSIAFFIALGACLVALAVTLNIGWIVINWRTGIMLVLPDARESSDGPAGGAGWRETRVRLRPGDARELRIAVPVGPFTVVVRTYPLTVPGAFGASGDLRALGLQFSPVAVPGLEEPL